MRWAANWSSASGDSWFARTPKLTYSTSNARFEEITTKAGSRARTTGGASTAPWGLAGLWHTWTDKTTGEVVESYTMTLSADLHPLMNRMHKPDPKLAPDRQDKRSVVPIEFDDVGTWLSGSLEAAAALVRLAPAEVFDAGPVAP